MVAVPLASLVLLPFLDPTDPAPGLTRRKSVSRSLDCRRVTTEEASTLYPGLIEPPKPRGEAVERDVVLCTQRLLPPGTRLARDEAVLSNLESSVVGFAEAAASLRPDLADRTWLVQAYYPDDTVAAKISFAAKNALMTENLVVSDRAPMLAAGDIDVITRMPTDERHPVACRRFAELGTLGPEHVLLSVVHRDDRATVLHAGLCDRGRWTWLR